MLFVELESLSQNGVSLIGWSEAVAVGLAWRVGVSRGRSPGRFSVDFPDVVGNGGEVQLAAGCGEMRPLRENRLRIVLRVPMLGSRSHLGACRPLILRVFGAGVPSLLVGLLRPAAALTLVIERLRGAVGGPCPGR